MKSAPDYLSLDQTNDAFETIARSQGRSKRMCKAIRSAVIPDGCVPQFTKPAKETQFLEDATNFILSLDNDNGKKPIINMKEFYCHGNTNHRKCDLFWQYFIRVTDLENGSSDHHQCKFAADTDTTTNVLFAPGLFSIPHIFQATIDILEREGNVKDTDFFVPGEQWVYMQFSPNNEYCRRAKYYCGVYHT